MSSIQVFNENFDELCAAIECLYIPGNQSGRIHFSQQNPQAARLILGAELMGFDINGTDDFEARARYEHEAQVKQAQILKDLSEVKERTVVDGMLQKDYVADTIERLGRDFAALVFSADIMAKNAPQKEITPAPALEEEPQEPAAVTVSVKKGESAADMNKLIGEKPFAAG